MATQYIKYAKKREKKMVPGVFEKKNLGYFVSKYITNKI